MKTLSIIIVNFNTRNLILRCIESVFENINLLDYELIVWDNNSSDGSVESIRARYPQVKLICSKDNLGFGAGNNAAVRQASGKYILLLNPDTLIKKDSIGALIKFAEDYPGAGAWGGVCELPNGNIDSGSRQIFPSLTRRFKDLLGFAGHDFSRMNRSEEFEGEVQVLSGAFMMMRREFWHEIGGFDESFILYCEETDLCYRIKKAGYNILMTGKARIIHDTGGGDPYDPKRMLFRLRGTMQFYRKYYTTFGAAIAVILIWIYCFERFIGSYIIELFSHDGPYTSIRRRFTQVTIQPGKWWKGWQGNAL